MSAEPDEPIAYDPESRSSVSVGSRPGKNCPDPTSPLRSTGGLRGRRVLDNTQRNLKAVHKLLGHSSISTTADTYVDWDIDQLADTLREILDAEGEA